MKLATHQRELLNRCSSSPNLIALIITGVFFGLAWSCFFLVLMRHTAVDFCWWYIAIYIGIQGIQTWHSAGDIIAYKNMCLWVFGNYEEATRKEAHDEIFKLTSNTTTYRAQVVFSLTLLTHVGILFACIIAKWWILLCVYATTVFVQTISKVICTLLVRSYVKKISPQHVFSDSDEQDPYTCVKDFFPEDFTWTPTVMTKATTPVKNKPQERKARRVRFKP